MAIIKKIISKLLSYLGYTLVRTGREKERLFAEFSQEGGLFRRSSFGLEVNSVIDVGASDGQWSKMCSKYFPKAHYMLIEANQRHEESLRKFCGKNRKFNYILAAAGDSDGQIYFDNTTLFGGTASHTPSAGNSVLVEAKKIDSIVNEFNLEPPYIIKLDTHGFEVPVLTGAVNTLESANLLIIEAYNFRITKESMKFHELCSYMEKKGFSIIDIADPVHRKKDYAFWQMDLFFIKRNSKIFDYNSYN
jgi:FkbM family methyltransferase